MRDLLPIVFSIVLFIITLVIISVLRKADQKGRRLELMKRYVAQHEADLKQIGFGFKATAAKAEEEIAHSRQEIINLLQHLKSQQDDIQEHSDDLEELQKTITYYHEVLGQLSAMTEKAETRTTLVKSEIAKVEQVRATIDDFFVQITEAEELMQREKSHLETLVEKQNQRMLVQIEESVAEAKNQIDDLLQKALEHTDVSFQTMISTVQAFLIELNNRTELLETVVKRLTETSTASMLALSTVIDDKREELNQHAGSLENIALKRLEMENQIGEMTTMRDSLNSELESAERNLEELHTKLGMAQDEVIHQREIADELDIVLAEKQAMLEEEERKELLRRAACIDPEIDPYDEEPDLVQELDLEQEPDLEQESERRRIVHGHFDPEEDEEEIIIDDNDDIS